MFESSYLELDLNKLVNNRKFIMSLSGPRCKVSTVVKGNAYGHGIVEFVKLATMAGVNHFSVYSADEAYEVFNALPSKPEILIMGNIEADAIDWAVENNIGFYVFDLDRLEKALTSAQAQNKMARIHIELETGMNRTGMNAQSLCKALEIINANKSYLLIEGVCTHFAGAESSINHNRVGSQMDRFNELKKIFGEHFINPGMTHTSCSAGMINYPQYNHDLVRIGIMNYGFWPNNETKKRFMKLNGYAVSPLKRIISWKSRIMSVQHIGKDEYIGYGLSYRTNQPMVVAIVPVGYAHGYDRSLSNLGHVLIKGKKASITGIVNMNCIAVDITTIPDPMPGDEVVLIGRQGNHEITISSFSETLHVLNYELLTRLPRNIPRIIIRNGFPDTQ